MMKRRIMAYDETPRSSKAATTTEVKIKITKKELEMLLGNYTVVEVKDELPSAHFFSQPIVELQPIDIDDAFEMQPRSWRPSLQSIPEMD